jgi:hypothetical protein
MRVYQRFGGICHLHVQLLSACFLLDRCFAYSFDHEDRGDMSLRKVSQMLLGYTASYLRTPISTYN